MASFCCFRWALCLLAVVSSAAVFAPDVSAQAPPFSTNPGGDSFSAFGQCFNEAAARAIADQGHTPGAPADGSGSAFLDPESFLQQSWTCSLDFANTVFVPVSKRVLWSLAILMLVWTGVQHMFGRGFNLSSLLNYFMLIGFALIILDNYYRPTHNFFPPEYGFVQVVARQVTTWSQEIYRTTEVEFDAAFATSRRILDTGADNAQFLADNDPDVAEDVAARPSNADLIDQINAGFDDPATGSDGPFQSLSKFIVSVIIVVMQRFIGLVLWVIRWILVGQYMWGWFMLSLLSLVGPLFVPAIVISQVDWLFWNWFRGLLSACVYMLSAAALYAVSMILLLTPLRFINNAT